MATKIEWADITINPFVGCSTGGSGRSSGGIILAQGINRVPHSLDPDYRDAAEFEARVGELLAQKEGTWEPCCYGQCLYGMVVDAETCGQCRMKHARLVVEAEMEREEACPKN